MEELVTVLPVCRLLSDSRNKKHRKTQENTTRTALIHHLFSQLPSSGRSSPIPFVPSVKRNFSKLHAYGNEYNAPTWSTYRHAYYRRYRQHLGRFYGNGECSGCVEDAGTKSPMQSTETGDGDRRHITTVEPLPAVIARLGWDPPRSISGLPSVCHRLG